MTNGQALIRESVPTEFEEHLLCLRDEYQNVTSVRQVRRISGTQFTISTPYGVAEVVTTGRGNYGVNAVCCSGDAIGDPPSIWSAPEVEWQQQVNTSILDWIFKNEDAIVAELEKKGGAS